MTSGEVLAALRVHYPEAQFALLEQVGNGTGYSVNRHADALVMSLWPSRGLDITGIEIKVSRSDWKRELDKPDKAEPIAKYCDFWTVAAPVGIVDPLTLPVPWGLLEVCPYGAALVVKVTKKPERLEPKPLDRTFLAGILRQAQSNAPTLEMWAEARNEAWNKVQPDIATAIETRTASLRNELERLRERVAAFEAETGIALEGTGNRYAYGGYPDGKALGRAVAFIASGGTRELSRQLAELHSTVGRIKDQTEEARRAIGPETA